MKRIGILGHPLRPETGVICDQVAASLAAHGIETWQQVIWEAEAIHEMVAKSDMIIAIGGDGAMLRAGRLCAFLDIPVFGINAGHLGFLTESDPAHWGEVVAPLLAGEYWIEHRLMICAQLWRDGVCLTQGHALNDVVIGRGASTKLVQLDAFIDGAWATTYNADGLVIATPTGSTAYALAVGGPILPPELHNILVVPIAPHLSLDRPIVLAQGAMIEVVIVRGKQANVMLNIDGEASTALNEGDRIRVQASNHHSQFVRLRDKNYFYRSILERLEPRIIDRSGPKNL